MITLLHIPILVLCTFVLVAMWRFWACIDRMGAMREVSRRAPALVHGDLVAAASAMTPFVLAAIDWSGITLPGQAAPMSSYLAAFLSLGCVGLCIFMLRNANERIAGHWAGSRESAVRTLAALRIIDAAELAYAVDAIEHHENRNNAGRVIDAEAQEVGK